MSPPSPDSSAPERRLLVIVRHGAAESFAPEDQQRRLTDRGRRQARETGAWLAEQGVVPTHAFVSSATRTRQTWDELEASVGRSVRPLFEDAVYSADTDGALEVLRGAEPGAAVVMLLGHNPTAASLAHLLDDGDPDPEAFRRMSPGFPAASAAVLEISVPWTDLESATGHLVAFHAGGG